MGNQSFLLNGTTEKSKSLKEEINELKKSSIVFVDSWKNNDLFLASEVSEQAMKSLDHIVNEIMRKRDELIKNNALTNSSFEMEIKITIGKIYSPVSISERQDLLSCGAGLYNFPLEAKSTTLDILLNKIKHRMPNEMNFKIGANNEHLFYIYVGAGMGKDNAIVEFEIRDFCSKCYRIEQII